ncbi:MAG: hypothetical protein ACREDD_04990 [Methylocella sp.]
MVLATKPPRAGVAAGAAGSSSCDPADDGHAHILLRPRAQAFSRVRPLLFRIPAKTRGRKTKKVRAKQKKAPRARTVIEISGERIGPEFEVELRAIRRALKGAPFVAACNRLCVPVLEFEPGWNRHGGMITSSLRPAVIDDLRRELQKRRIRFSRTGKPASGGPLFHFEELLRRAGRARMGCVGSVWLRIDLSNHIIATSPPLYFGQSRKF